MKFHWKKIGRVLWITLVVLMVVTGGVIAQQKLAPSDSGIFEAAPSSGVNGNPDGTVILPKGVPQAPVGSDSGIINSPPSNKSSTNPVADENRPATGAPALSQSGLVSSNFSYYFVSGATLRARSSVTTFAYDSMGCIHVTAGSANTLILNTELHIPDGSLVKYVRLYYSDTSTTGYVRALLTSYTPGSLTEDLVGVSSDVAFSGGNGTALSAELNVTVDNANYAYTLIGWPSSADAGLQICGIRVAYFAPISSMVYIPSITR
jgi:hypothetical protein